MAFMLFVGIAQLDGFDGFLTARTFGSEGVELVGNEKSVDAMFHQIQGIHRTIEPQRVA